MSKGYFEGWYLKHQKDQHVFSVIPAFHKNTNGEWSASIQIITENASYVAEYECLSNKKVLPYIKNKKQNFYCQIDKNTFSETGIVLNIKQKGLAIKANILYGTWQRPKTDVMGIFRYVPNMQCNHGVLSFCHTMMGSVNINGKEMNFSGGVGYIEKDFGTSFPKKYIWTQCNWNQKNCIMASIADIPVPFLKKSFIGCICTIYYEGKEYRMATYTGVKIRRISKRKVVLKQGKYQLDIMLIKELPFLLQAPRNGIMSRKIQESPICKVKYQFSYDKRVIFKEISHIASYEYVTNKAFDLDEIDIVK